MTPLMVLGCSSDAGKSLVATALCRWFARRGVNVAPFKAQNMTDKVIEVDGGEVGTAQWMQALAANQTPTVEMNPVLLKPTADTASQVVVCGELDETLSNTPWNDRHDAIWTPMADSFDHLNAKHELVIIEGAGSPAEINLRDQVNNRMLEHADAAALLVVDIDRGGAFAHLFGTWSLVPEATQQRLAGFILNKFRGDASLLSPGPERLVEMTTMAHAGVLPWVRHDLPREDGGPAHTAADLDPERLNTTFDLLADAIDQHLDTQLLESLVTGSTTFGALKDASAPSRQSWTRSGLRDVVQEWEHEHGSFTEDELSQARSRLGD